MFLDSDERLIVVDQKAALMSQEEKRLMCEAGVRTVLPEGTVSWHDIEPRRGIHHWDNTDRYVNETRKTGLKILLPVYSLAPSWVPGVVCSNDIDLYWHVPRSWLDPLSEEGALLELEFIQQLLERYTAADICCYYAVPVTGECMLPPTLEYTEKQAIEIVLHRQELFAQYTTDLWTSFHPAIRTGNEHCNAVYTALESSFPDHVHHRLLWTYFTCADTQWKLDRRYWVGAEYAKNVVANATRLNRWGARGLIMAPYNWRSGPGVIDDRVISATRTALKILGQTAQSAQAKERQ